MPHLEESGKNLNEDIGNLVKKEFPVKFKKHSIQLELLETMLFILEN